MGRGKRSRPIPLPAARGTSSKLVIVDVPGAAQTQVRVASIGVPRSTPDFEALAVLPSGFHSAKVVTTRCK